MEGNPSLWGRFGKNKSCASIRIGIPNFPIYRLATPQTTQSYGDNNEIINAVVYFGTQEPSPLSKMMPTLMRQNVNLTVDVNKTNLGFVVCFLLGDSPGV